MNRVGTSRNTDAILTDLTDLVTLRDLLTYDFYLHLSTNLEHSQGRPERLEMLDSPGIKHGMHSLENDIFRGQ